MIEVWNNSKVAPKRACRSGMKAGVNVAGEQSWGKDAY